MNGRDFKKGKSSPTEHHIRAYWKEHPLGEHLNQVKGWINNGGKSERPCMACGGYGNIKCHITPLSICGSNEYSNLHMLCDICHKESEGLYGYPYWLWILLKAKLFDGGSDMTFEIDDGKKYHYEEEYPDKLAKYAKEYTMLSIVKNWDLPHASFYLTETLLNWHLFDIDLTLIDDIDEMAQLDLEEYGGRNKQRAVRSQLEKEIISTVKGASE